MRLLSFVTLALSALFPLTSHVAQAAPTNATPDCVPGPVYTIFVGAYDGKFHAIKFSSGVGLNTLEILDTSCDAGAGPSWATWSRENPTSIYVSDDHGAASSQNVVQLAWDPDASKFSKISAGTTALDGTVHLALSKLPGVPCLYAAGYGSGGVSAQSLGTDGDYAGTLQLVEPALITFDGSGPIHGKQDSSHAHQLVEDPRTGVVYVPDLGTDSIHRLVLDSAEECVLRRYEGGTQDVFVKEGSGPRHLVIYRDDAAGYAYLINELSATVQAFAISNDDGSLTPIGDEVHVNPPGVDDPSKIAPSEIALSPDANFLYAGIRNVPDTDDDLIALLRRDADTGGFQDGVEHLSSGGKVPRHFSISQDGQYIVVANQGPTAEDGGEACREDLKNVAVLARHPATGLTSVVATLAIPGGAVFAQFWEPQAFA